jgi:hypothetical protein
MLSDYQTVFLFDFDPIGTIAHDFLFSSNFIRAE